jgi:hypothetical protein
MSTSDTSLLSTSPATRRMMVRRIIICSGVGVVLEWCCSVVAVVLEDDYLQGVID